MYNVIMEDGGQVSFRAANISWTERWESVRVHPILWTRNVSECLLMEPKLCFTRGWSSTITRLLTASFPLGTVLVLGQLGFQCHPLFGCITAMLMCNGDLYMFLFQTCTNRVL